VAEVSQQLSQGSVLNQKLQFFVLKAVGLRVLAAAAILLAVLQILDLLEVTTEILDRGLGVGGVFYYAALRFPRLVEQVAPLSVLAGGLFAFAQLARENAIVAMRAAGLSIYRLVLMAAPAALVAMLIYAAAAELVGPRTDPILQAWWRDTTPAADKADPPPRAFRVGPDVVVAKAGDAAGRRLREVKIYRRDDQGRLSERIEAPTAIYAPAGWRLQNPSIVRFSDQGGVTSQAAQMAWTSNLKPGDVQALFSADQIPSGASARRALAGGGAERPRSYYAVRLQRAYAGPAGILVMLMLAAPVGLGNFRNRQGAILTVAGLGAGLLFLVADGLLSALGESAVLSPVLAAWTAPVVFAALAATTLLRMEG
jgi:lipopolysaccharide export system permease protein